MSRLLTALVLKRNELEAEIQDRLPRPTAQQFAEMLVLEQWRDWIDNLVQVECKADDDENTAVFRLLRSLDLPAADVLGAPDVQVSPSVELAQIVVAHVHEFHSRAWRAEDALQRIHTAIKAHRDTVYLGHGKDEILQPLQLLRKIVVDAVWHWRHPE